MSGGRRWRAGSALVAAMTLLLAVAGCGDDDDAAAGGDAAGTCGGESARISVSAGGATVTYPFYVGVGAGYFEDAGVDVQLIDAAGAGGILGATVSGDTDGSILTMPAVVEAIEEGAPLKAIASLQVGPTLGIPLTQDYLDRAGWEPGQTITSEDLADAPHMNVGVTQIGGGGDLFGRLILEDAGLEEGEDFDVQALGDQPSMVAAWGRGIVDAMVATPSAILPAVDEYGGGFLFDPFTQRLADISDTLADLDIQQGSVLVANERSLDGGDSEAMLTCLMEGVHSSLQAITEDPEAAGEAAREYFEQFADDDEGWAAVAEGVANQTPDSTVLQQDYVEGTLATFDTDLTFDDIVDNSIAESGGNG